MRAAGLAAAGSGDCESAYAYLRGMFDRDGRPLHPFIAARSISELVAMATRTHHQAGVRVVVDRVRADAGAEPSDRMRLLLHLYEALLDETGQAEDHFTVATQDPGLLTAASEAFAALGATRATELADRELRAGGTVVTKHLKGLTPREQQVALLAADGLRNRQIAEQLLMSTRTVGAHLHSAYHKLGLTGRHQLRDAVIGPGRAGG